MATLNDFMPNVITSDTRKRQQCNEVLSRYLSDPRSSLACDDIDGFIEGLAAWVTCSNYKISVNGLEIMCLMVDRMGEDFKPHVPTALAACIDRLGDSKDQVREQAQELLLKLMMPASTPQYVFERLMGAFTHKLWHVREGVLICLQNTINRYGARCLQLSKIVPSICKLLEDQTPQVREASLNTLAEIYRHVGEKVRNDLTKKGISQARLNQVFQRFDDVKMSGNMLATADLGPGRGDRSEDESEFARPLSTKVPHAKRTSSTTSNSSTGSLGRKSGIALTKSASSVSSRSSFRRKSSDSGSGGVDEETFIKSFEDVPKVQMFSARDMTDHLNKCKDTLADTNIAWQKRIDALFTLRGILVNGGQDYDDFYPFLRMLEPCFINCVKDLRSQIVREGCITIAYFSQRLGSKFDHGAETLLPVLLNLIPNSAKIMASSGTVCVRFILQYTFASRLIPIITNNLSSKASIIRRFCCECLNQVLHTWPTHILEKHIAILQEAIKKGISDADSEARSFARKSFWGFADHFRDQADALLNHLDPAKQKALQGELSNSSSNNSLNSGERLTAGRIRARSASQDRGYESSTLGRVNKKGHQRFRSARSDTGGDLDTDDIDGPAEDLESFSDSAHRLGQNGMMRSSSAVDIAQGASTSTPRRRSSSSLMTARMSTGSTQSLPRQKSHVPSSYSSSRISPADHPSRNRTRLGTSQSQPSSRSSSPTPRHSYITHTSGHAAPLTPSRPRKSSTAPRSQGTSREGSPSRSIKSSGYGLPGRERRLSGSKTGTKMGINSKTLRPGQDTEELLADALRQPMRKRYESYDSDDNASETSSVCSERSYSSYGKTSEDMGEILGLLQSNSYQDRKEGLICLQKLLRQNRYLTRIELKKATEVFNRMFHDPHSKVFSLFLEMLIDLIHLHSRDLGDWLFIILSRLLNKVGSDILGSLQAKVQRALDATRENFPCDLQFNIMTRFMIDQTQSPSLKVKQAILNYLIGLVPCMEPGDFSNSGDTRLVLSRLVTWTNEPKNQEIRKASQTVLIALFNLNPPEFSMMLSGLPKAFQDGATRILQNHLRSTSEQHEVLTPRNTASPTTPQNRSRPPSREEMDKEKIIWAQLSGVPQRMMWPVKIVDLPLVYCQSDNAWLYLKDGAKTEPFPNNIEKWTSVAEKCLKRRLKTLDAFKRDVEWGLETFANIEERKPETTMCIDATHNVRPCEQHALEIRDPVRSDLIDKFVPVETFASIEESKTKCVDTTSCVGPSDKHSLEINDFSNMEDVNFICKLIPLDTVKSIEERATNCKKSTCCVRPSGKHFLEIKEKNNFNDKGIPEKILKSIKEGETNCEELTRRDRSPDKNSLEIKENSDLIEKVIPEKILKSINEGATNCGESTSCDRSSGIHSLEIKEISDLIDKVILEKTFKSIEERSTNCSDSSSCDRPSDKYSHIDKVIKEETIKSIEERSKNCANSTGCGKLSDKHSLENKENSDMLDKVAKEETFKSIEERATNYADSSNFDRSSDKHSHIDKFIQDETFKSIEVRATNCKKSTCCVRPSGKHLEIKENCDLIDKVAQKETFNNIQERDCEESTSERPWDKPSSSSDKSNSVEKGRKRSWIVSDSDSDDTKKNPCKKHKKPIDDIVISESEGQERDCEESTSERPWGKPSSSSDKRNSVEKGRKRRWIVSDSDSDDTKKSPCKKHKKPIDNIVISESEGQERDCEESTSERPWDKPSSSSDKSYSVEKGRKRRWIVSDSDSDDTKKSPCRKHKKPIDDIVISESEGHDSCNSDIYPMLNEQEHVNSLAEKGENTDQRKCARDKLNDKIFVSLVEKSEFSKSGKRTTTDRVYNSRHPCPFCKKIKTNFSHHILSKQHQEEKEIVEISKADITERKRLIAKLRLKACHEHNMKVLENKKGEIFLLRRSNSASPADDDSDENDDSEISSQTFDISRYGPCPFCLGWVLKQSLKRHAAFCNSSLPSSCTRKLLEVQSDIIIGNVGSEASQVMIDEVFPIMKSDEITKTAKSDDLIINLGNQWLLRNRGNQIMRKYYTSSIMRLVAKLKIQCQTLSKSKMDLTDYLAPTHFETILKAALICSHMDDEEDLKAPSNAIKLGFDLKRMLSAKLCKAIMAGNSVQEKEAKDFLKIMELQWSLRVTKLARGLLTERSFNKTHELPRPADVKRLNEYLQKEISDLDLNNHSYANFRKTAILSLARLTLYNRRRCHEVQAMSLASYTARKIGVDDIAAEIRGELSEFEMKLLLRQEVVIIRGKTGKGVPVIIPPDEIKPLEFLASATVRRQAGIPLDNRYVFANNGAGVVRAYDAIREVTESADLIVPTLVRSSNMRKYMATMLQALNTTESERQWVIDHLGHTMNVHRIHYRQTSDILERVDVAKVLLIQDMGLVSKYRGKRIEDIQIEDVFNDAEESTDQIPQPGKEARELMGAIECNSDDFIPEIYDEEEEDEVEEEVKIKKKKPCTRQKWTEEEVKELKTLFSEDFRNDTLPGQKRIEGFMKKSRVENGVIWKRKRDTIKKKINNMMIKNRNTIVD